MCGICGFVGNKNEKTLVEMCNVMSHRGPDEQGIYIEDQVHLGHQRLSIIDLSNGKQPLIRQDLKLVIVFNGEIYNYTELRKELISLGYEFFTNSDTETIIVGYHCWGNKIVNYLNGMFAFAIYDKNKNILFAARDRMGKKPFYYCSKNGFYFSSELKSMLKHPIFKDRQICKHALHNYLAFEYIPAPLTIFKDIYKLPAGHTLSYNLNTSVVTTEMYWDADLQPPKDYYSEEQYIIEIQNTLLRAVERRLMSEVPLGVFLSGGIDSSSIVATMSKLMDVKKIKTFAIGFDNPSFDESSYARKIADFFGTDHYEKKLSTNEMINLVPEILALLDEPMADPSLIPTYYLSKFTREHVTVALGGDGGDELFAGYDPFKALKVAQIYDKYVPVTFHRMIEKFSGYIPVSMNNMSFDFKIKQFLKGVKKNPAIQNFVWLGSFSSDQIKRLLNYEVTDEDVYGPAYNYYKNVKSLSMEESSLYLYQKLYLQDGILTKVDRASMAVSLEVRAPFLDKEMVELANSIPLNLKLNKYSTKYILKKSLEGILPNDILYRKKKGFGMPIGDWFRNELKNFVAEVLSKDNILKVGIFDYKEVQNILNEHWLGKKDNKKQIWTLMVFHIWYNQWFNKYC